MKTRKQKETGETRKCEKNNGLNQIRKRSALVRAKRI